MNRLIRENGHRGYIMGADCSIPNEIKDGRIHWIARQLREKENRIGKGGTEIKEGEEKQKGERNQRGEQNQ